MLAAYRKLNVHNLYLIVGWYYHNRICK